MNLKKSIIALAAIAALGGGLSIAKKTLDHTSFDAWKSVTTDALTNNGEWVAYNVDPQEGDGILTIYNTKNGRKIDIARGYNISFTADGKWAVAKIKPFYAATRKAKIAKKKSFDLPQDSLAIVNLTSSAVEKIPNVIAYKTAEKGGDWVAYTSCDTTYIKKSALKAKDGGKPLVVRHLPKDTKKVIKNVSYFGFDRSGSKLAVVVKKQKKDSLSYDGICLLDLPDTTLLVVDRDRKFYGNPVFDRAGSKFAYMTSDDTIKTGTKHAVTNLALIENKKVRKEEFRSLFRNEKGDTLLPNQYTRPRFSYDGRRLITGVAPVIAPDDTTIVDFERADLDIWRWDAPATPPQELHAVKRTREQNLPVAIDLSDKKQILPSSAMLSTVISGSRWDGDWVLVSDVTEDAVERQWNYNAPRRLTLVNLRTGERRDLGKNTMGASLSASDKYVVWFSEKNYYTYDIQTGDTVNVTANIPYPVWDNDDDHPSAPSPWGGVYWSANDDRMLLYDKYDIWSVDPKGKAQPECLTAGEGRKRNLRFRYTNMDPERRWLSKGDEMLLTVFDFTDKYQGLATMNYGKPAAPAVSVLDGHAYTQVKKALDKNVYIWQRANFSESPDVWLCMGNNFANARRLSDANPQMKDYNWGTARLVKWHAYDGKESEGVLYVPDNLDPNKKYPMLTVFYETGSEKLYNHFTMEPSWSWVNYPFYVGRGYVVFVPDIHYTAGTPGESCYNYVCSGVEEMCRRYPWIDKDRIGIDGQSWGGYQTAYLVTRTNMFACAGSGAPVANMTSAYGGIRWESGSSRQGQYEQGQSRIGRNLWEAPELYVANSPVFHANRVNTPLLIMHNDQDGAVPWYQGIEMFMALRRLQKPVWMLQYNGEAHNIRARKNRKDITIRLQQFFDHYLKGDPMPKWMKDGIPAVRKGQEMGY